MRPIRTVGVVGKRQDPRVAATLRNLHDCLLELGRTVLAEEDCEADLPQARRVPGPQLAQEVDLLVVVGGDGTLLDAGRRYSPAGVPILGVNQGRLGFMVDVPPAALRETLKEVLAGRCVLEPRLILEATVKRRNDVVGPLLAVNDVVIRNQAAVRMLEFETWMGDEFISVHRADGIIVSSPTGSTAYALSGGGPVLHPSLQAISLVPICPHTLSDRPLVVGAKHRVRIVLRGQEGVRAVCTWDGQLMETLAPDDTVEICGAAMPLQLLHPSTYNYFNILRNKLHWGRERLSER